MDTKQQVLSNLSNLLKDNQITEAEVKQVLKSQISTHTGKINMQKVLYYMGGIILFLGIAFYVSHYWLLFDRTTRILIALISSLSTFFLGYYFSKQKNIDLAQSLFLVSILLLPLAISTLLEILGMPLYTNATISIDAAIVFMVYFGIYYTLKAPVFLPFVFITATILFFSITNFITQAMDPIAHFYEYRFYLAGVAYLLFGYYFFSIPKRYMTNVLYVVGLFMILSSGIALEGFKPHVQLIWEILYVPLLILVFYCSIRLQSAIFLVFAALFTCVEIFKITSENFSGSIGWPLSLIVAGICMMGVGYITFQAKNKYLQSSY